jgi:hypothetical protein
MRIYDYLTAKKTGAFLRCALERLALLVANLRVCGRVQGKLRYSEPIFAEL